MLCKTMFFRDDTFDIASLRKSHWLETSLQIKSFNRNYFVCELLSAPILLGLQCAFLCNHSYNKY